jgi:hypothetical protein
LADYLANESIKIINKEVYSAIDPCCGSGVFILAIIKKIIGSKDVISLTDKEKENLLKTILLGVKGIDINPLSVLTARVSYFLAIRPLFNGDDVEIPVYLGDSANIPSMVTIEGTECYHYLVSTKQDTIPVILPKSFVECEDFFSLMSQVQAIVKTEDEDLVYQKIINNIAEKEIN